MNGLLFLLLLGVAIIALAVTVLALTNRVVFKMGARNFSRRKAQSAIVVAGLMIGTAIISASLVVGDTMRYIFENDTYHSLGELDEEISGASQFGTSQYFGMDVYRSVSENLSKVEGIQAVAPAIFESVSAFDLRTRLAEPSVTLTGYDSSVMRATAFGDLDGHGLYTDRPGATEIYINSRMADAMDARTQDTLQLSLGVRNATNPLATELVRANFTVAGIIQEKELYGKANLGQGKSLFMELGRAQELLGRTGQIDSILISNKGDTWGGEGWTGKVNGSIRKALDDAVGMRDMGLSLFRGNSTMGLAALVLVGDRGYFPSTYLDVVTEVSDRAGAYVLNGTLIPLLVVNGSPARGTFAIAGTDVIPEGVLLTSNETATALGLVNGSVVPVTGLGLDGVARTVELNVSAGGVPDWLLSLMSSLPAGFPNITMVVTGTNTSDWILTGNAFPLNSVSLAAVIGNGTQLDVLSPLIARALDDNITASDLNLKVSDLKFDQLKTGRASGSSVGDIFMVFSVFSIIAGVVLIINIFVMLAEERKSEMGMARAVGMKRKHLIRMFLFEGTIYVFLSSAIGALLGLAIGKALIVAFAFMFGSAAGTFPFYFTWDSVLTAFCLGVLLTFTTIFFASRRSANLNIIRAIRGIPEPRGSRAKSGDLMLGAALLAGGVLALLWAISARTALGWMVAPCVLALGLAIISYKWVHIRAPITAASLFMIFWIFKPSWISEAIHGKTAASGSGLDLFIASGILLVLAGVLLVMFNSDLLLRGLQRAVGNYKATRAVLKTAISYPMEGKFKTGMTLTMFALIVFTVTVIAMIASMQASTMENERIRQSGGYDIIGYSNPATPFDNLTVQNLPDSLRANYTFRQLETLSAAYVDIRHYDAKGGSSGGSGPTVASARVINTLLGASDSFLDNNGFPLQGRDKNYSSDRQCWQALKGNGSLCIIDGSKLVGGAISAGPSFGGPAAGAYVGGTVTVADLSGQNRTRTLTIIGIMYEQYFFQGVIVNKETVRQEYGGADRYLLADLAPGQNVDAATKDLKRAYLDNGMQALDIPALIALITTTVSSVMYLMEGFLAIGLFIGIAGIGIISYRNVIERRQQIGMMRAIGFRRRNITTSFLIETSFITVIAIVMGVVFGIGIGWQIYDGGGYRDMGAGFVIPWENLLVITVGAYIATLIFTFYPSIMAARIPPAEALRYIE